MADRVLFIGWGRVVAGREERALEVFNESMGFYGRLQQQGKIEGFNTVLLDPNARLAGYIELRGSAKQIADCRVDDDFRQLQADAAMIVDELCLYDGACVKGVEKQVGIFQRAMGKVPQMTG